MTGGLDAHFLVKKNGFRLDLKLRIEPSQTVALLGPNGAGKTTALEALAGLTGLSGGYVRLDGEVWEDVTAGYFQAPARRRIGVMFQDGALFPHLSAVDNVAFGLQSRRIPRRQALEVAEEWLAKVGMAEMCRHRPAQLSGGERQRVALARALAIEPTLLLLDEPFSALDVSSRVRLRRVLADHLKDFPGPSLLITHDPAEAFLLADRLIILEEGEVIQEGDADQIRLRPASRYAADLAGVNLLPGVASGRVLTVGSHRLIIAEEASGRVIAHIHPRAISIHNHRPEGSPRNTWQTDIERIEHFGDRVRLQTGPPAPVTAEITPDAAAGMSLVAGSTVWLSVKATEIRLSR
ncbi:MAG: ABC transporter ATP-binding protein [bacterium]|nr:ABC transporter ATP-binding protein [bacterium]MCY3579115.1 ABC transporter ATP-binding protein [bacterium]MCY3653185.1 ABC transporter ATP-binding protein [bacterium]MDE0642655.1 ABC transporter ATP-binding protein [bacterium]MYD04124.1 ABC transporter ATP-binding protein [Acidimicrobiia bacterium]